MSNCASRAPKSRINIPLLDAQSAPQKFAPTTRSAHYRAVKMKFDWRAKPIMRSVLPRSVVPRQASTALRLLLAALVVIVLGGLAITLVQLTDTALSIQERLARLPMWAAYPLAAALIGLGGVIAYLLWRLLRPAKIKPALSQVITREAVLARVEALNSGQSLDSGKNNSAVSRANAEQEQHLVAAAHEELAELDRRANSDSLYLALFGEISTGKSSLIRALTGEAVEVSVTGGTTLHAKVYRAQLAGEQLDQAQALMISDVPGTNEADAGARGVLAREEALRAHVVALVVTGDLSRAEASEWQWLVAFGKPVWLILNKIDRYCESELAQLLRRLKEKFGTEPIAVSAGYDESVSVIDANGMESQRLRKIPAKVAPLQARLTQFSKENQGNKAKLEPARSHAVLNALDLKLRGAEHSRRLAQGEQIVTQYTRRAMIGAMASVAPGSDLVIQGALSFGLVKALTELYGISMTKLDIDDLLALLGGKLKGSITLLLAIAGNAAKAFPGLGTLGGGALHAVAYGLLFQSVGRALLECLDRQLLDARGGVDRLALLKHLSVELTDHRQLIGRATKLAREFSKSATDR